MITEILRIILGGVFALFIPGYAVTLALFKEGEIDMVERIALSFALSIATVPLILFYLNWGMGIKINFINLTVIVLLIVILSLIISNKIHLKIKNPKLNQNPKIQND